MTTVADTQAFLSWWEAVGTPQPLVEVRCSDVGGLGTFASKEIQGGPSGNGDKTRGVDVVIVPRHLIYTDAVAFETPPAKEIQDKVPSIEPRALFYFMIALERKGFSKLFAPYFQCLPDYISLPTVWPKETLEKYLAGTGLYSLVDARKSWLQLEFSKLTKVFGDPVKLSSFPEASISWSDFLWAYTVYSSRAFPRLLALPPPEDASLVMPGIILPFADMMNHKKRSPVSWNQHPDGVAITVHTNVAKGEEIFNNYGGKPNEELLMHYGFAEENNPEDCVTITLGLSKEDALLTKRIRVYSLSGCHIHHHCFASGITPDIMASMRVAFLSEEQLDSLLALARQDLLAIHANLMAAGTTAQPSAEQFVEEVMASLPATLDDFLQAEARAAGHVVQTEEAPISVGKKPARPRPWDGTCPTLHMMVRSSISLENSMQALECLEVLFSNKLATHLQYHPEDAYEREESMEETSECYEAIASQYYRSGQVSILSFVINQLQQSKDAYPDSFSVSSKVRPITRRSLASMEEQKDQFFQSVECQGDMTGIPDHSEGKGWSISALTSASPFCTFDEECFGRFPFAEEHKEAALEKLVQLPPEAQLALLLLIEACEGANSPFHEFLMRIGGLEVPEEEANGSHDHKRQKVDQKEPKKQKPSAKPPLYSPFLLRSSQRSKMMKCWKNLAAAMQARGEELQGLYESDVRPLVEALQKDRINTKMFDWKFFMKAAVIVDAFALLVHNNPDDLVLLPQFPAPRRCAGNPRVINSPVTSPTLEYPPILSLTRGDNGCLALVSPCELQPGDEVFFPLLGSCTPEDVLLRYGTCLVNAACGDVAEGDLYKVLRRDTLITQSKQ